MKEFSKTNAFPNIYENKRLLTDTAVLGLNDYERIRKNARMYSKEETANNQRLLTEQREAQNAKAKSLREKIIEFDKTRLNKYGQSDIELEDAARDQLILERAQRSQIRNEDPVKKMEKLVLYAKTATIRDRQLNDRKNMATMYNLKETKLDVMMEVERLKELKLQEIRENFRKQQQREGASVIVDQIKEREIERLKEKEILEKERTSILNQIKAIEEEDKRQQEQKRIKVEELAKEVSQINQNAYVAKEKARLADKELDLKMMRYNMDKAKKEEEELAEKKRIREEKEKELQKLREKQEKAQDKQAELDALRAKRAYEDNERKMRQKEKIELLIRQKKIEDLLIANKKQKLDKELKLAEHAKLDQEEYEKIIHKQIETLERDRRIEEERKRLRYEHNNDLLTQIKVREENNKVEQRDVLEEGRKIRQNRDLYSMRMEKIKQQKIKELKELNIMPKYIADLERYKIV